METPTHTHCIYSESKIGLVIGEMDKGKMIGNNIENQSHADLVPCAFGDLLLRDPSLEPGRVTSQQTLVLGWH